MGRANRTLAAKLWPDWRRRVETPRPRYTWLTLSCAALTTVCLAASAWLAWASGNSHSAAIIAATAVLAGYSAFFIRRYGK
jgi:hypothetical protein